MHTDSHHVLQRPALPGSRKGMRGFSKGDGNFGRGERWSYGRRDEAAADRWGEGGCSGAWHHMRR